MAQVHQMAVAAAAAAAAAAAVHFITGMYSKAAASLARQSDMKSECVPCFKWSACPQNVC